MSISVVIPAYNEENRISKTLDSYSNLLGKNDEIIIVCNGCKDKTPEIVRQYIKKNKNIKLLNFRDKIGKGGAIIEGLKLAKKDYIGFVDADDSFDAESVIYMTKYLKDFDGVIASKWLDHGFLQVKEDASKKFFSRGWNLLARIILGLKFYDTQAGAKFFRKEAIDKIKNKLQSKGFEFDVELLYLLKKNKFKTKEVFVDYNIVEGSTFSLKYIPKMFINLLKIYFR
jgi:glycosyltransferase involved in cell wall biosynthesis